MEEEVCVTPSSSSLSLFFLFFFWRGGEDVSVMRIMQRPSSMQKNHRINYVNVVRHTQSAALKGCMRA